MSDKSGQESNEKVLPPFSLPLTHVFLEMLLLIIRRRLCFTLLMIFSRIYMT